MDKINIENYSESLSQFIEKNNLTKKKISTSMNCSTATIERLLNRNSLPTDEMIKQTGVLLAIGFENYSKLTKAQKEKISDVLGTVSGAGLGFASITAVVGGLGTVGLSGAGIMSGLAALGGIVGSGAAAGIVVVAAAPLAAGAAGYGLIKGVKYLTGRYKQKNSVIDSRWEVTRTTFL